MSKTCVQHMYTCSFIRKIFSFFLKQFLLRTPVYLFFIEGGTVHFEMVFPKIT